MTFVNQMHCQRVDSLYTASLSQPNAARPRMGSTGFELDHSARFPSTLEFLLLRSIYHMPFSWRKFILVACHIQRPFLDNKSLTERAIDIGMDDYIVYVLNPQGNPKLRRVTLKEVISWLDNYIDSPSILTLFSYFSRAESTSRINEAREKLQQTITKETRASMQPPVSQQLQYTCLFTENNTTGIHSEIGLVPHRTIFLWKTRLRSFVTHLSHNNAP